MTTTAFNRELKAITTNGFLDSAKAKALDDEKKTALMDHIIRTRQPLIEDLVPSFLAIGDKRGWLHACGYLYRSKGGVEGKSEYWFLHTCEHQIRYQRIQQNDFQI